METVYAFAKRNARLALTGRASSVLRDVRNRVIKEGGEAEYFPFDLASYSEIPLFIKEIKNHFKVLYNKDLTLITIRHYTDNTINEQTSGRKMFIQQKSRKTARFVVS